MFVSNSDQHQFFSANPEEAVTIIKTSKRKSKIELLSDLSKHVALYKKSVNGILLTLDEDDLKIKISEIRF